MQFLKNSKVNLQRVLLHWNHSGIFIQTYTIMFGGCQLYLIYSRVCENSWLASVHIFAFLATLVTFYYTGKGNLLNHRNKSLETFQ